MYVKDVNFFILMQFEGAYKLINDCKKNSKPTTSMYNVILAGYFREVALVLDCIYIFFLFLQVWFSQQLANYLIGVYI